MPVHQQIPSEIVSMRNKAPSKLYEQGISEGKLELQKLSKIFFFFPPIRTRDIFCQRRVKLFLLWKDEWALQNFIPSKIKVA